MTRASQRDWLRALDIGSPSYRTEYGAAFLGDSKDFLAKLPPNSVNAIITSPPFALHKKKEYDNVPPEAYVKWFHPFAELFKRVLTEDGSLVVDLGSGWTKGQPTRSLYQYELLLDLCKRVGFFLAQDFYWFNPAKLPTPAEWVTIRRERVKDSVDTIWWLSKSPHPKADNKRVLKEYSEAMRNLLKNGYKAKLRPSGHNISTKFRRDLGGAIPPNMFEPENLPDLLASPWGPSNLLRHANTESSSKYLLFCAKAGLRIHPARWPANIPRFFVNFLTDEDDLVLDPFGGSNVTGQVAESLRRRWLCFEVEREYLEGSKFRFEKVRHPKITDFE